MIRKILATGAMAAVVIGSTTPLAAAVGRTCLSRETDQAPMKSRPAALRHPAGGMTSNGHDRTAGQHGNEPTRRAHHRTVSLMHGKGQCADAAARLALSGGSTSPPPHEGTSFTKARVAWDLFNVTVVFSSPVP